MVNSRDASVTEIAAEVAQNIGFMLSTQVIDYRGVV